MSMELMVKVMKLEVGSPLRKLVLLKLADNASDSGECWPSYQHVAEQCEMDRRTAMRHIKKLEKDGFLRVIKRRKDKLQNQSNVYQLSLEKGSVTESLGGSVTESLGSVTKSLGGSVTKSPRTSHSFEPLKKNKQKKVQSIDFSEALGLASESSLRNWIEHRKAIKKPMSQRAFDLSIQNFVKIGNELSLEVFTLQDGALVLPVDQLIDYTIEAGWQSVKAEWIRNRETSNQQQTGSRASYPAALTADDLAGDW